MRSQQRLAQKHVRITDGAFNLALKMTGHVLLEQSDPICYATVLRELGECTNQWSFGTHLRPENLLDSKDPRPPSCFLHPHPLHILHLNLVQWPIGWYLEFDFQLMFVHQICCRYLINIRRNFNRQVLVRQLGSGFRTLDVSQFRSYDDWGEVQGRVGGDTVRQLAVLAVQNPVVDQRRHGQEGAIVQMSCKDLKTPQTVSRFIDWTQSDSSRLNATNTYNPRNTRR
ncbi:unnamed protein product, partial [Mycena citricolor]